ncbi:unnamed protein product [Miscanthus lutarioriparius]|uniref:Uncharacterized protein n=1 Tax=Miscanthus lutarioriparius TaxID=422564 RepID=A0A811R777_9POAL|nr:unnamed protein product [Miscanthus lutarioriparius]
MSAPSLRLTFLLPPSFFSSCEISGHHSFNGRPGRALPAGVCLCKDRESSACARCCRLATPHGRHPAPAPTLAAAAIVELVDLRTQLGGGVAGCWAPRDSPRARRRGAGTGELGAKFMAAGAGPVRRVGELRGGATGALGLVPPQPPRTPRAPPTTPRSPPAAVSASGLSGHAVAAAAEVTVDTSTSSASTHSGKRLSLSHQQDVANGHELGVEADFAFCSSASMAVCGPRPSRTTFKDGVAPDAVVLNMAIAACAQAGRWRGWHGRTECGQTAAMLGALSA